MTDATSDTRELTVREPDTGDVIGRVPVLGPDEVRAQARRAREAGRGWRATSLDRRCRHLRRLRRLIVEEMDDVAGTVARETGKTLVDVYLARSSRPATTWPGPRSTPRTCWANGASGASAPGPIGVA